MVFFSAVIFCVSRVTDVCGYVKNASQVGVRRRDGYAEKQFMISLESRIKNDVT